MIAKSELSEQDKNIPAILSKIMIFVSIGFPVSFVDSLRLGVTHHCTM